MKKIINVMLIVAMLFALPMGIFATQYQDRPIIFMISQENFNSETTLSPLSKTDKKEIDKADVVVFNNISLDKNINVLANTLIQQNKMVYFLTTGSELNSIINNIEGLKIESIECDTSHIAAIYFYRDDSGIVMGTKSIVDINDYSRKPSDILKDNLIAEIISETYLSTDQNPITPNAGTGHYAKTTNEISCIGNGILLGTVKSDYEFVRKSEVVNGSQHLWSVVGVTVVRAKASDTNAFKAIGGLENATTPFQNIMDSTYLSGSGVTISASMSAAGFSVSVSFPRDGMTFKNTSPTVHKYRWEGTTNDGSHQMLQMKYGIMVLNTSGALGIGTTTACALGARPVPFTLADKYYVYYITDY